MPEIFRIWNGNENLLESVLAEIDCDGIGDWKSGAGGERRWGQWDKEWNFPPFLFSLCTLCLDFIFLRKLGNSEFLRESVGSALRLLIPLKPIPISKSFVTDFNK